MSAIYRYQLGRKAIRCPQCGRREFKPYVSTADGSVLDPACGRCNREIKCGYSLSPREFFARNGRHTAGRATLPPRPRTAPPAAAPPGMVPPHIVATSMARPAASEPLHALLAATFGADIAAAVAADYLFAAGRLHGRPAALYWLVDSQGRARSGKLMLYGADGHRLRCESGPPATAYVHTRLQPHFRYAQCYFGAHLLPRWPGAQVMVVESEKTALWLACMLRARRRWGSVVVVATGGSAGLAVDFTRILDSCYRANDLRGRHIVLAPDADATDKWLEAVPGLRRVCASVRLLDIRHLAVSPTDDPMDVALRYPDAVLPPAD